MANYDLAFTGAQIDSAIGKVQNAETTVENSTNMIQSAAVFTELNNLTTGNLSPGTLVTSGVTFPDNNTTIPTCAAVKAFVNTSSANALYTATYTAAQGTSEIGLTYQHNLSQNLPFTTSGGGMTLDGNGKAIVPVTGTYEMIWSQYVRDNDAGVRVENNTGDGSRTIIRYYVNGTIINQSDSNPSVSTYSPSNSPTTWTLTRKASRVFTLNQGDALVANMIRSSSGNTGFYRSGELTLNLVTPLYVALVAAGF